MLDKAIEFASQKHEGQTRKYTGEPYIVHPLEVMSILQGVGVSEVVLVAAVLHDVVEDTPTTFQDIESEFGSEVSALVKEVSDVSVPEDGNRSVRKEIDLKHYAGASPEGKTIKLADMISNSGLIGKYDPAFAKVYMLEKRKLLEVLKQGESSLLEEAKQIVDRYFEYQDVGPG